MVLRWSALLIHIVIPSPHSVHTLRQWIEDIQENVKTETALVTRVGYCYQSRRNVNFSLLSLLNKDQGNQYSEFSSLRHNVARLGEHVKTVESLLAVQKEYPKLLDAKVECPITSPGAHPFPDLRETPLSDIIHSTISTKKDMESCYSALQVITNCFSEKANPEAYIQDVCGRATSTRVHAELVLLDWFRSNNSKYLDEDRYIGCSKDACYSCDRYGQALFAEEKVTFRGCHNKLYLAWRPPDVPVFSDVQTKTYKEILLQRMMGIVRSDLHKQLQRTDRRAWHPDSSTGMTSQVSAALKEEWQAKLAARSKINVEELNDSMGQTTLQDSNSSGGETVVDSGPVDPDLPQLESHLCSNCLKVASQRCSVCQVTYYCSRVCQNLEWKHFHGPLCKSYNDFQQRPSQNHKRGLFFSTDSRDPRWIWVPVEWQPPKDGETGWEMAQLGDLLGAGPREHHQMSASHKHMRYLTKTIALTWRDNFMNDGSPFNMSIAKATNGSIGHRWAGPIVCMARKGTDSNPAYYGDLEITDIRDVVDYFGEYSKYTAEPRPSKDREIPGVRVSCVGDMREFGYEQFTPAAVPLRNNNLGDTSGITRRVGFPLLMRKQPPDILWQDDHQSAYENTLPSWLFINDDPASDSWGWIRKNWLDNIGSVIVTRADWGPLSPLDVEIMCRFCFDYVAPLFANSIGAGRRDMTKEEVLAEINPEKWRKFREMYLWSYVKGANSKSTN